MFLGLCKKDEYDKFKTEIAEHNKIHTECIEKYDNIKSRLRDMERIYETYINDSRLQEFRNKLEDEKTNEQTPTQTQSHKRL